MYSEDIDEMNYSENLKGKTLKIYFYMLSQNKPLSAREIQRNIGLSSPSLSLHHLKKLNEMGLVELDDSGLYIISRYVKVGVLKLFVGRGLLMVPRFLVYSFFSLAVLLTSLYLFGGVLTSERVILFIVLIIMNIIFWYETVSIWKTKPV